MPQHQRHGLFARHGRRARRAAGIDGRMLSVLHCKSVPDTSDSHTEVTPTNICTLTRLLDIDGLHTQLVTSHLHQLLVNVGLVEADVNRVPGGHHVVVVDDLRGKYFIRDILIRK